MVTQQKQMEIELVVLNKTPKLFEIEKIKQQFFINFLITTVEALLFYLLCFCYTNVFAYQRWKHDGLGMFRYGYYIKWMMLVLKSQPHAIGRHWTLDILSNINEHIH